MYHVPLASESEGNRGDGDDLCRRCPQEQLRGREPRCRDRAKTEARGRRDEIELRESPATWGARESLAITSSDHSNTLT